MAINPHSMKPVEIARLLNSTPLGTVVDRATVYRHYNRAGLRIAATTAGSESGKRIDLLRYIAWLFLEWRRRREASANLAGMSYEDRHRLYAAERSRRMSESVRDIGDIPPVENPERKESCRRDLARFIMTYAPEGKDPFSDDHFRVIKRIENAIFHGGRFVEAVFRGFGKSTISELTAVWAACYGHKRFIPIIGANQTRATDNLDSIKGIFESDLLLADFPEICYPIQRLEGINQRSHGQLYRGQPTHIEWSADYLVLPMIEGSAAAGCVILACGITSSKVRGMKKRRGDGVQLRPDFVIIDDPQDEESAASVQQISKRLNIIRKAIIRSAGHTTGMSVVMPCTVIQKDDLVDQLLDPKKNPAWQGERIPFVRKWSESSAGSQPLASTRIVASYGKEISLGASPRTIARCKSPHEMWMDEYARLRNTYNPDDPNDQLRARAEANAYYAANRAEMDRGCTVSWEYCFSRDEGELSAIQHAYNALIDDGEEVFASEFQNAPLAAPEEEGQLTVDEIAARLNNLRRYDIPTACEKLTAFVDVQGKCLYYVVCGWSTNFTGYVVDYGIFPDPRKSYITLREITKTLQMAFPGTGQEGAWRSGMDALTRKLIEREWKRDDGTILRLSRCLIDANDGNAAQTVYDFWRQSAHAAIVMPSRGKGITAASMPFSDYRRKVGDRVSEWNWRIPAASRASAASGRNAVRYIIFDTNYWKSFLRSRWRVALGDPSCLSVFGRNASGISSGSSAGENATTAIYTKSRQCLPGTGKMFAEHMTSEYSVRTEGRGRTVDEWQIRPGRTENHFWDCIVGCAVAASEQGIVLTGSTPAGKARKPAIKLSALQKR